MALCVEGVPVLLLSSKAETELPLTLFLQGLQSASWVDTEQIFLLPWHLGLCYRKWRNCSFLKNQACPSTRDQTKKYNCTSFFLGFRKKSRSLFYWVFSTSSLEAGQCAGVCERNDIIAVKDSPHLSSFTMWISNSNLQSHSTSLQD